MSAAPHAQHGAKPSSGQSSGDPRRQLRCFYPRAVALPQRFGYTPLYRSSFSFEPILRTRIHGPERRLGFVGRWYEPRSVLICSYVPSDSPPAASRRVSRMTPTGPMRSPGVPTLECKWSVTTYGTRLGAAAFEKPRRAPTRFGISTSFRHVFASPQPEIPTPPVNFCMYVLLRPHRSSIRNCVCKRRLRFAPGPVKGPAPSPLVLSPEKLSLTVKLAK